MLEDFYGFLPNPQRSPLPKLLVDRCRGKANKRRHCRSVAVVSPNPPGERPATVPEETTGFWNSLEQGRTSPKEKDCDCQICYINTYHSIKNAGRGAIHNKGDFVVNEVDFLVFEV